jgi:DNA-binding transcriptional MerR regulator
LEGREVNEMRKRMNLILVAALAIAIGAGAVAYAGRGGRCERRGPVGSMLTEEQRAEIRAMVTEMRDAGASPEDIHAAVRSKMEGYGIEVPEDFGKHRPRHRIFSQLTEEQRETIHAKLREMREAGASREEIHAAVREMLKSFGIDLPEAGEDGSPLPLGESKGRGVYWGRIKGQFR